MITKEDIEIGRAIKNKKEICQRASDFYKDYLHIRKAVHKLVNGVDGVFMSLNRRHYWDFGMWGDQEFLSNSFRIKQSGEIMSDYTIYLR